MKFIKVVADKLLIFPKQENKEQIDFTSPKSFDWFLDFEKRRSLRNGGVVCVLQVDFTKMVGYTRKVFSTNHFIKKCWKGVQAIMRESDIGFVFGHNIKIILTNTGKEGAELVGERMYENLESLLEKELTSNDIKSALEIELFVWDYKTKRKYKAVINERDYVDN